MYWHSIPNIRIQKLGLFGCLPLSQHSKDLQFSHQSCYSGNHIVDHYTFAFNTEYCVIYFRKYQSFPTSTSFVCLVGCVRCQVETLSWMALLCQQVCHGRSIRPCMGEGSVVCKVNHVTDSQLTAPWNKAIKGSRHLVPPLYNFSFRQTKVCVSNDRLSLLSCHVPKTQYLLHWWWSAITCNDKEVRTYPH